MNYEEIQPNRELRAYARQQLNGFWKAMAFTFFVYTLLYIPYYSFSILNSFLDSINKYDFLSIPYYMILNSIDMYMPDIEMIIRVINIILSLAVAIIAGPFALGFAGYFLKRVRGQGIATKNIFDGFYLFWKSLGTQFFVQLFTTLWCLLFIIPGIIKAFAYSMAFYIIHDNPELDLFEAIKRSQIMMKGYKFKLFLLELSFIGWGLLCLLTLGIGFFWLYPYIGLSMANFYENLKRNQEKQAAAKPDPFAAPGLSSN